MQPEEPQPEEYYSVAEAARILGWRIGTLRARIKRGTLVVHHIVGKQALTRSQLEELSKKGYRKRNKPSSN